MLAKALGIVFFCLSSSALAFYASSDVIELNEAEFKKQVHHFLSDNDCL
jgi:hypothetical protein